MMVQFECSAKLMAWVGLQSLGLSCSVTPKRHDPWVKIDVGCCQGRSQDLSLGGTNQIEGLLEDILHYLPDNQLKISSSYGIWGGFRGDIVPPLPLPGIAPGCYHVPHMERDVSMNKIGRGMLACCLDVGGIHHRRGAPATGSIQHHTSESVSYSWHGGRLHIHIV